MVVGFTNNIYFIYITLFLLALRNSKISRPYYWRVKYSGTLCAADRQIFGDVQSIILVRS